MAVLVSCQRPPDALNVGAPFGRFPEDRGTQRQTMAWLRALRSNALCTSCGSGFKGCGLLVSDTPPRWKSPIRMPSERNRGYATTVNRSADDERIGTVQKTFERAGVQSRKDRMTNIVYEIVEHDGGWAYKLGDVFSETYPSKELATAAANDVAERQQVAGEPEVVQYQDAKGSWREESVSGDDRPEVDVRDGAT
jgi:Uncharacterized protein conserved in bacteria (DUF2188)